MMFFLSKRRIWFRGAFDNRLYILCGCCLPVEGSFPLPLKTNPFSSVEQGLIIKLAACATDVTRTGTIGLFDRTLRGSTAKGVLAAQVYREIAHACIVRCARAARASVKRHRQGVLQG